MIIRTADLNEPETLLSALARRSDNAEGWRTLMSARLYLLEGPDKAPAPHVDLFTRTLALVDAALAMPAR